MSKVLENVRWRVFQDCEETISLPIATKIDSEVLIEVLKSDFVKAGLPDDCELSVSYVVDGQEKFITFYNGTSDVEDENICVESGSELIAASIRACADLTSDYHYELLYAENDGEELSVEEYLKTYAEEHGVDFNS